MVTSLGGRERVYALSPSGGKAVYLACRNLRMWDLIHFNVEYDLRSFIGEAIFKRYVWKKTASNNLGASGEAVLNKT